MILLFTDFGLPYIGQMKAVLAREVPGMAAIELFTDVPAWDVHPDLVELAGGPSPVAERARKQLDAGAPVEALHLAETALAADPDHRGALEASLAAHQQLESESTNFWLTSWIRREITRLKERLG